MSRQYIGIEPARKNLGDLVEAAQQGIDTILTRNGRPVARITAYTPEDTMTSLDLTAEAARVIARARANSGQTAPEFDYAIGVDTHTHVNGIGNLNSPLGVATYEIANEGHGGTPDEREDRAQQLFEQLQPELTAYAHRCRDRKYSGWSAAAKSRGQRINYAD